MLAKVIEMMNGEGIGVELENSLARGPTSTAQKLESAGKLGFIFKDARLFLECAEGEQVYSSQLLALAKSNGLFVQQSISCTNEDFEGHELTQHRSQPKAGEAPSGRFDFSGQARKQTNSQIQKDPSGPFSIW